MKESIFCSSFFLDSLINYRCQLELASYKHSDNNKNEDKENRKEEKQVGGFV